MAPEQQRKNRALKTGGCGTRPDENARATSLRMTLCAHGGLVMTAKTDEDEKLPFETQASRAPQLLLLWRAPSRRSRAPWATKDRKVLANFRSIGTWR